jgi:hypothetical protein
MYSGACRIFSVIISMSPVEEDEDEGFNVHDG